MLEKADQLATLVPPVVNRVTSGPIRIGRSDALRHLPGQGEHPTHPLVAGISGRIEHQRAAAVDYLDPVRTTVLGRALRHAAASACPVHPHVPDTQLDTL